MRLPATLAAIALAGATLHAQVEIPIATKIAEVEQYLNAKRPADAIGLLDEIIKAVKAGKELPAGVTMERLLMSAANANFQSQQFARAAELAAELEKLPSIPSSTLAEARMIRGLSLALQEKYADAVPVFRSAAESRDYRDRALLYAAMSAAQAKQLPVAIELYSIILRDSAQDRDWADAALTLIDLHLTAGNVKEAREGLGRLRGKITLVDNIAGLNVLSLKLGDSLLKEKDTAGALAAFRTLLSRDVLIAEQEKRIAALDRAVKRLQAVPRPTATETDMIRRFNGRLEQCRNSLKQIQELAGYDATIRYRLAYTFQERGGAWEAALLYEDLLANHPESAERENAFFGLVRAYADAGRFDKVTESVDRFTRAYPNSKFGPQAIYLAAVAAGRRQDAAAQLTFLNLAIDKYPDHELTESLRMMQANVLFTTGKFGEAKATVSEYSKKFPSGKFIQEARYLAAMADLIEGRASAAEEQIKAYLADFPEGNFVADARYRLAAAAYARQDYAASLKLCEEWLAEFKDGKDQSGEVYSLKGDSLAGLERIEDAILAYHQALNLKLSDDQMGYVLDELNKHYMARREFDAAVAMWDAFARENPDHPFVLNAAYWISRIRSREGRLDEAMELVSNITRRYVGDPARGEVERLLVEIASTLARPVRVRSGEPKPAPVADDVLFARVDQLLLNLDTRNSPTAQARALFTQSEIAGIRKNEKLRAELLGQIASKYPPEQLPPGILGKVGDHLLAIGQPDLARKFYEHIILVYPRSIFADYGHVGLGEIALLDGNGSEALARFNAAIDVAGARFKLKEATLGRARAQFLLGRMDEAKSLFEQVAGNRAWRGEATAEAIFNLGEIAARDGSADGLAKADAHFKRVYLSYKRFAPWVARAYVRSAEVLEKTGQIQAAVDTVNRMFTEDRLRPYTAEWEQAKAIYNRLQSRLPAPGTAAATPAPATSS